MKVHTNRANLDVARALLALHTKLGSILLLQIYGVSLRGVEKMLHNERQVTVQTNTAVVNKIDHNNKYS